MYARVVLGVGKGVLFREVSSVQECPRERFHCIIHATHSPILSVRISLLLCFSLSAHSLLSSRCE